MHFHRLGYFSSKLLTFKHLSCARKSRAKGRTILTLYPGVLVPSQWPNQPIFLSACQNRKEFQVLLLTWGSLANPQQRCLLQAPVHRPSCHPSLITSRAPKSPPGDEGCSSVALHLSRCWISPKVKPTSFLFHPATGLSLLRSPARLFSVFSVSFSATAAAKLMPAHMPCVSLATRCSPPRSPRVPPKRRSQGSV